MTELEVAADRLRVAQYEANQAEAEMERLHSAYVEAVDASHTASAALRAASRALFDVATGKVNA